MSEENKARESQVEKVIRFHRLSVASVMSDKPLTESEAIELNELENKIWMLDTHEIIYSAYSQAQAEIEKLKKQNEILQGALTAVYVFWKDIDTPKPYFIGDTCEEALREVEGME